MKRSINTRPGRPIIRSRCMNENGAALVIGLMFIAILGMLGTTGYVMTSTDLQIGGNYKASVMALNDSEAGIYYAIGKIEEGLKAWPRTFTLPTSTVPSSPLLSSLTVPTGFGFTYQTTGTSPVFDITEVSTDPDIYKFTVNGTGPQNSSAVLEVECERLPAIRFGAFGDKKLDLGNTAAVYSYSHATTPSPTPADSTGEGDAGSNESVILRNNSIVDGDVALGEDATDTDGTLTDQGGVVSGTNGQDIPRVTPDPLGVVGGEYAANFTTYSVTNDNASHAVVAPGSTITTTGASLTIGPNETLTLKGQAGGSNFYWHDLTVKSDFLYIDTTNGPVNIYVTGTFDAKSGSQVINTTDASCSTNGATPATSSCACCDTATPTPNNTCTRGAPGDFAIFANSTTSTDKVSIGNSVEFSGLIYAPYILARMDNSADIYGAIMAGELEIVNSVSIYFDTDMQDEMASNDLAIVSWRDNRM